MNKVAIVDDGNNCWRIEYENGKIIRKARIKDSKYCPGYKIDGKYIHTICNNTENCCVHGLPKCSKCGSIKLEGYCYYCCINFDCGKCKKQFIYNDSNFAFCGEHLYKLKIDQRVNPEKTIRLCKCTKGVPVEEFVYIDGRSIHGTEFRNDEVIHRSGVPNVFKTMKYERSRCLETICPHDTSTFNICNLPYKSKRCMLVMNRTAGSYCYDCSRISKNKCSFDGPVGKNHCRNYIFNDPKYIEISSCRHCATFYTCVECGIEKYDKWHRKICGECITSKRKIICGKCNNEFKMGTRSYPVWFGKYSIWDIGRVSKYRCFQCIYQKSLKVEYYLLFYDMNDGKDIFERIKQNTNTKLDLEQMIDIYFLLDEKYRKTDFLYYLSHHNEALEYLSRRPDRSMATLAMRTGVLPFELILKIITYI